MSSAAKVRNAFGTGLRELNKGGAARDSLIYLTSTVINMALPFLLLPVFTRLLTPDQFGPVVVVQGALTFLSTVLVLGLRPMVLREFVTGKITIARATFGGAVIVSFALTLVLALGCILLLVTGIELIAMPSRWLLYVVVAAGLGIPLQYYLASLQARGRAKTYGLAQSSVTILGATMSISFILFLAGDWTSRAAGILLGPVIAGIAALLIAWRTDLIARPNRTILREHFGLAWASLPHVAINALLGFADRLFVAHIASKATLAYYGVASQLCLVPIALGTALNTALAPWWMKQLAAMRTLDDWQRLRRRGILISSVVGVACLVYVVLLYPLSFIILPPLYLNSWVFIPMLFAASLFNVVYFQFVHPIFYFKRAKILGRIGYANLVITVVAMVALAHWFGAQGIATALALSRLFLLLSTLTFADRVVREELDRLPG